jgi:hypothetical protein
MKMKNNFSKNMVIATMTIVGTLLLVSTIINSSSSNMSANAQPQQQQSSKEAPEKGTIFVFNEKSRPANEPEKCAALASVVKGKALPDYNLCDIVVYRQAPSIVRNDGMVLNNFSGLGHYIEMVPAVVNNTGVFNSKGTPTNQSSSPQKQDNLKVAFGEWSVIDEEVVPVQQVMQKYNWTQTALHHHMLNESPKILFLHWSVTGDANELIKQAKEIIMQTSTYQNLTGNTRTPTSGGP